MNRKHAELRRKANVYSVPAKLSYAYGTLGHFGKPASGQYEARDRREKSQKALDNASAHFADRERQAREAKLDWDYVGQILKADPELTLAEAKQMAWDFGTARKGAKK